MPIVIVHGISSQASQKNLKLSKELIVLTVSGIRELRVGKEQVSVFFPRDLVLRGDKEVIIFVEGLLEKAERTDKVRNKLAECLVKNVSKSLPEINLVECIIKPLDPREGFYSLKKA